VLGDNGKIDRGLTFDDNSDNAYTPTGVLNPTNPFTINFWFNSTINSGIGEIMSSITSFDGTPKITSSDINDNTWRMVTIQRNVTNDWTLLMDNVIQGSLSSVGGNEFLLRRDDSDTLELYVETSGVSGAITLGATTCGNCNKDGFIGTLDEIGVWNRTLSSSELTDLYNGGDGMTYTVAFNPSITLISPENNSKYNSSPQIVSFNCSSEDDSEVKNVTLFINGIANFTQDGDSSNFTELYREISLLDGNYNWTCIGVNDDSLEGTTVIRDFLIDGIDPIVNITSPEAQTYLKALGDNNFTLNFSASDNNLDSCWYNNETANVTLTCGLNSSEVFSGGSHTIIYYANDTLGNEASNSVTFFVNYYYENFTYTDPAVELQTYDFGLNVTATAIDTFNGTFYYNGVPQITSYSDNGTVGVLSSTGITASTIGNITFDWVYHLDGTLINSSNSHAVMEIQNLSVSASGCAAGLSEALHYDFKGEKNSTSLNNTIDYIFRYGISNNTLRTTAGSLESTTLSVCINSTVWNNYSIGYGEIQYQPVGYSDRRYYTFSADRISNVTVTNQVYSLVSGSGTSFLFTIQKGDLSVYDGVYLTLNRWYPEEDEYKVVEMGKTDDEGNTVMKVEIEDVDYRVGVYETDGTLIYLAAPFRLVCIASPCTYSLTVPEDAGNSFENWKDLQVSLDFNTTTSIFTMVYNDPSQDTSTIGLNVYRDTGMSELLICSDNASSYTGVLTCNVSGYTGLLRAIGFRTASPETSVISKTVQQATPKLGKTPALFLSVILMIFLVSVGVVSPILTVILSILAFIPALIFGVMPLPILLIIAAMGFIVIHFMKRSVN